MLDHSMLLDVTVSNNLLVCSAVTFFNKKALETDNQQKFNTSIKRTTW